jgi:Family of unknown function (DUF6788)
MATPPRRTARRVHPDGHADGVIYRQQYVRCGKPACRHCPPHDPGHGPYWYGFYWDYRQRTRSFYVGKTLPAGVALIQEPPPLPTAAPTLPNESTKGGAA